MQSDLNLKKDKTLTIVTTILASIIVAVCAVIIFFNLTHEYHVIKGSSMMPTLNNNSTDGVFVSTIKPYTRGDIIVYEKEDGVHVIKRIIAMGGDKLKVEQIDGQVRIVLIYAGEQEQTVLDEPYLENYENNSILQTRFDKMIIDCALTLDANGFFQLEENQIFYLGDNRKVSNDCSIYGPKNKSGVVGKVDYIAYGNSFIYFQVLKQVFGGK